METVAQKKVGVREGMRARLARLSPADVRVASAAIWERLAMVPKFASAQAMLMYVSRGNEVDTHGLIQQLLAMGKRVAVPSFDAGAQRYFASELNDFEGDMSEGRFGILEPRRECVRPLAADKLEVWLVPGLAFDKTGNRLGRGLGFFDRLLRETTGARIALAYDFQVLNEVPADAHDVRVDFIVTEKRVV
jgi:5-formyltetrahydrofolate cyclo-ligase